MRPQTNNVPRCLPSGVSESVILCEKLVSNILLEPEEENDAQT